MQAFGRAELASPVAEAIRKMQLSKLTCEDCENCILNYPNDNEHWCDENEVVVNFDDEICDKFKKEGI